MRHILLLVLVACAHNPSPPRPDPMAQTGDREHRMANCPSALSGATTELVMTASGVDVVIRADSADVRKQIVELSERHARMGDPSGLPQHSGLHGGPGTYGFCPIVHDATSVTADRTDAGAIVHVRALAPDKVSALQDETRSRLTHLQARADGH